MVNRAYLLKKSSGPGRSKLFLDQTIVPALIDAAGLVEGLLERVAVTARRRPLESIGAAVGLGTLATLLLVPPRDA